MNAPLKKIFPLSLQLTGEPDPPLAADQFIEHLQANAGQWPDYPFLPELADLEMAVCRLGSTNPCRSVPISRLIVNPTLRVFESKWCGLPEYLSDQTRQPTKRNSLVLLFKAPSGTVVVRTAGSNDLLALKIVAENLEPGELAVETDVPLGAVEAVLDSAIDRGLLLSPRSSIARDPGYAMYPADEERFRTASTFTLQWHLTQACDLNCRHCYDRSSRASMPKEQAIGVLDSFHAFTKAHHVRGQISFSGGNPLLYPHFFEIYREAADRGFQVAVLGNPTSDDILGRLIAIRKPAFYQVSLEGLREHNDYIRGPGHFDRVLDFLSLLRRRSIYSMVMLTLTKANADDVPLLAEALQGRSDLFTFNRLAMVGEGAELASLEVGRFPVFLRHFLQNAAHKPFLSLKDNCFNIVLAQEQRPLTGGCTGFGCGAAFNFVSLLPDGEVHACRKFPSLIGNIHENSLSEIYHGEQAASYRRGPSDCLDCLLRPACRGCMAVAHGFGLDVFKDRDPYCFRED